MMDVSSIVLLLRIRRPLGSTLTDTRFPFTTPSDPARAMDALIRYAGETRNFPGVEAARDAIEEMKEIPMAAGQQGRFTIGLAVANNEAAISHASTLIARAASDPELRFIVHPDLDAVLVQLMPSRARSE